MRKQRFLKISKAQSDSLNQMSDALCAEIVIWSGEDKYNWYFILEYGR